ncbi:metal ABC transporter ATP-binding protein [Helicobacter cappadocius]|uniref:ABC transporter ATP-binding protein n=1 Tax=Helicobacter cappadocius TaxID=3063998 RepID=A0AA90TA49_9HELI|nr:MULTISPECIES: ABC transporter ATP-binding protein [unclassified Helicobacter]MDO7253644.1 ABC transporter ATP-binding protein [Helicobacter sp. faydin-H75]MDP2539572.1 ABC transporter ATP-binding protein [Helicobacter sp. faydin-H76]
MELLQCEGLFYRYGSDYVLENVNFSVLQNDFLAVIGPNGGGKTTLIKILLGLFSPNKGKIFYPNSSVFNPNSLIGYVPQDTTINSDFPIQAIDVVRMGFLKKTILGCKVSKNETLLALEMLDKLGVKHLAYKRISELSGGQRQRVLIARALCGNPKLIILDEPTSSIDTKTQGEIYKILKSFNAFHTIIVISHDISVLLGYASRVLYVNKEVVVHKIPNLNLDTNGHICEVDLLDRFVI